MVEITFVQPDGSQKTIKANVGDSVMRTALANNIKGIFAECGGAMMCATCHCYVDEAWLDKTGVRNEEEIDMLECAASEMKDTSRLSCQLQVNAEMDGLIIHLPDEQT